MRIEPESDAVSASRKHLVFAYYVTGHGFGHATRVTEVPFLLSLFSKFLSFSGITSIFGPMGCLITLFFFIWKIRFWILGFQFWIWSTGKKRRRKKCSIFFLAFLNCWCRLFLFKRFKNFQVFLHCRCHFFFYIKNCVFWFVCLFYAMWILVWN